MIPSVPPQAVPSAPMANENICAMPDYVRDPRSGRCLASAWGSQNNCPDDYLYVDRLYRCIHFTSSDSFEMLATESFAVSGTYPIIISITEGQLVIAARDSDDMIIVDPGMSATISGGSAIVTASIFSRIRITD